MISPVYIPFETAIAKHGFTVILTISISCSLFAQENSTGEIIAAIAEEIAAENEETAEMETFTDRLYDLVSEPVRINSGDEKEIGRLFFLSISQVKALARYIKERGPVTSPSELGTIESIGTETARRIAPFITLANFDSETTTTPGKGFSQMLLNNFSVKQGIIDESSPGSQWKIVTKYKMAQGRLTAGFTAEKDAGEKYLTGRPSLPDFLTAYLALSGKGFIKRAIAGDFSANFGMGTAINTGFRTGVSLSEPGLITPANEIRPYTSTDENNFFRGVALVAGFRNTGISIFISSNNIDATIVFDDDSIPAIRSLYTAGLHNTSSTLAKKDLLKETGWGLNISSGCRNFSAGVILAGNRFSLPVIPDTSKPENIFSFRGTQNKSASLYYTLIARRLIFSGEISSGLNLRPAFTQAVTFAPAGRFTFSFLYWHYSPAYTAHHGKAVLSGARPSNEESIYGSVRFEAARHLFLSAGSEIKRRPWAGYLTRFPSLSLRNEVRIKYCPQEKINIETVYYYRRYESNLNVATGLAKVKEERINLLSLRIRYLPFEIVSLTTRADLKTFSDEPGDGMLLYQDAALKFSHLPLRIWMRYALFSTGGWGTRIYTFENDLLNSFNIPALYGEGSRSYIMADWKFGINAVLRIKYGITSKIITAGKEEFSGELKFQVIIKM